MTVVSSYYMAQYRFSRPKIRAASTVRSPLGLVHLAAGSKLVMTTTT